ncbi:VOC family protein [Mesorhizobium sp. INR15]|uniref:VOC family protein n=1 Tax=Mesorhizobium sp. INR15 TaxID=2654248 RepID=UPI0018966383|nr:VOC family protein [Mesorhizobium sp. INR15]QPC94990.1 ring-cleaving dioxygenase [Mesorhizobium sp. INR15]
MTSGIHHVTLITRDVQANVDFYVGFLGLRLVKRTGGYEDARQLHLFYGDETGAPGSLVTFLVWEDGSPGRVGHGQVGEFALAIDAASTGFWLERALRFHVPVEGPTREFGETVLRLRDPDGVIVKLVGTDRPAADQSSSDIPLQHTVRGIRSATIYSETPDLTASFIQQYFGFSRTAREGTIERLVSRAGDCIDIRDATGFWPGVPGTGTADHVAFRAADIEKLNGVHDALGSLNSSETTVHDRKYFTSLYVREPSGTLLELATDGPGFGVDEPPETLGTRLFVPGDATQADDIAAMLPQFSMPGDERIIYRDLPFVHRFFVPEQPDGSTLVLLHGTGGSEADLMPLARHAAPRATLLGVRGRSTEEGVSRWFRRTSPTVFDQQDIRSEAEAFAAFVAGASTAYGLDENRTVFVGYSNGANLLAAVMVLHPGLVRNAVLLRAIAVLDDMPPADLSGSKVLMLSGRSDPYHSPALEATLQADGAELEIHAIDAGHELVAADHHTMAQWLARIVS